MAQLDASIAAEMLAACRAGATQGAQAFCRALGGTFRLTISDLEPFKPEALDAATAGPGLLFVFTVADRGVAAWIAQSSGVLPGWVQKPDNVGQGKLSALAREFGRLIFPSGVSSMECQAEYADDCKSAVLRGLPASAAVTIPLVLIAGDRQANIPLVLPLEAPRQVFPHDHDDAGASLAEPHTTGDGHALADAPFQGLPPYTRSLLRIRVPVRVTLAEKRALVEDIVRLGPGSIVQFDKSCDEMLEMEVGNRRIAQGEAVKIGDKFGLRITGMVLPDERFHALAEHVE
jgi:flagellar motor switch protein FliN